MERTPVLASPSFCKLLIEDFKRGIRIPRSFSRTLEGRIYPSTYSLVTEDKRRSWRANVVKKDDDYYLCQKSWPEFVRDNKLKYGDYLLFHMIDKLTFWVTLYGAHGSKKKLSDSDDEDSSESTESDSNTEDDEFYIRTPHHDGKLKLIKRGSSSRSKMVRKPSDKGYCKIEQLFGSYEDYDNGSSSKRPVSGGRGYRFKEVDAVSRKIIAGISSAEEAAKWDHYYDLGVQKPYFIRTIKSQNKYFVVVPKAFAVKSNLIDAGEVLLRFEDGDFKAIWRAKIVKRDVGRIDIGEGWSEFRKEYQIQAGETCRFTVNNHFWAIIVTVHVYRSGGEINAQGWPRRLN